MANDDGSIAIAKARDRLTKDLTSLQSKYAQKDEELQALAASMSSIQRQIGALDSALAVLRGDDGLQGLSDQVAELIHTGPLGVERLSKLLPGVPKSNIYKVLTTARFTKVSRGVYDLSEKVYGTPKEDSQPTLLQGPCYPL